MLEDVEVTLDAVNKKATKKSGLARAAQKKRENSETMEEAWERISKMKNSNRDTIRLAEVREALESGKIGRTAEKVGRRFSKSEAMDLYKEIERQKTVHRLEEMRNNIPSNYILVTEEEELDKVVEEMGKEEVIVFDVETTGVNVYRDKLVGHVLSATSTDKHYYIPTGHNDSRRQLEDAVVTDKLRPVYENKEIKKIAHNAKFDYQILKKMGITVENIYWDTQEAMKLLNENEQSYALKPLVSKYLKQESYGYADLFGKGTGFDEIDLDTALAYAAKDGDITYQLYEFQRKHMSQVGNILEYFTTVEMELLPTIADMELHGYVIDREFAKEYSKQLHEQTESDRLEVLKALGDINLNSPVQLKEAIEKYIGRSIRNTNADDTLKPLAKEFPIIQKLLDYRGTTRLLSTYIDALPEIIEPSTDRLHANFFQNGTVTGRFSSRSPNLQNQSPESRRIFLADEGRYIVGADFSAQEVRIIAALSHEDVLLEAFERGLDPYASLASEFLNKPYEECYLKPDGEDTEERKQMKLVLLMSMYGAGKFGLATALGVSPEVAEKFLDDFFKKYRKIAQFIKRTQDFAKKHGYVWIGDKLRKRRLPDARRKRTFIPRGKWNDPKYDEAKRKNGAISRAMRQAPNALVQGLAAVQTKITMINLAEEAKVRDWVLHSTIHDEVLIQIPKEQVEEDVPVLERIMTESYLLEGVQNGTDIEIQQRWGDSVRYDEYLKGKRPNLIQKESD